MRRHKSLIPLSHDHHHGLHLAQIVKKDGPPLNGTNLDVKAKAEYALNKFKSDLKPHFEDEENIVFPAAAGKSEKIDILIKEIKTEHQLIYNIIEDIKNNEDLKNKLDSLGQHLEAHIRKEERELFPLIQEKLSEKELEHIEDQLKQRINE